MHKLFRRILDSYCSGIIKKFPVLIISLFLSLIIIISCTNPFSPRLENNSAGNFQLSDQKDVEGVFINFRYAYILKDTLVYGRLLDDNFTFTYRDYSQDDAPFKSWGRVEDMISTSGLFQASQNLDLTWNKAIVSTGDTILQDVTRGFTLTITFSANDIEQLQGRAKFRLTRKTQNDPWKILQWQDDSF